MRTTPSVAVDPEGMVTAVWSWWDGDHGQVQTASRPPGRTWSRPMTLSSCCEDAQVGAGHRGPDRQRHCTLARDARWPQLSIWWQRPGHQMVRGRLRSSCPRTACAHTALRSAAGSDGTVAAVWERRDGADDRVQAVVLIPVPREQEKKMKTTKTEVSKVKRMRFPMAASDPTMQWSRRRFLRLTGAGMVAMAGTAVTGWPKAWAADAARDPELLPGDAAHAWLREVYNVVWGANDSTPTNAARIYCYLSVAMYESVASASSSLRSLVGQLTGLRPLPQTPPGRIDPSCVLAGATRARSPTTSSGPPIRRRIDLLRSSRIRFIRAGRPACQPVS